MPAITPKQFQFIASLAKEYWGLHLSERKMDLVCNRLAKFLARSPYDSVDSYLEHLTSSADEEDRLVFFDILSTNVTSFFRERQHFDYLEREFYTPLARGATTLPSRRIRFWSAGCSTGCEPYSLAIHAAEHLPELARWDFRILATDLSNSAVQAAQAAVYPAGMVESLDQTIVKKYFQRGAGEQAGMVRVAPETRALVSIARLNLMEDWPMKGPFDVIFCRNVMIYFDRPTRERLVNRYCDLLRPGGILAIGSSETLSGINVPLRSVAPSTYVK
ncbi:MAG: protein-glutamate O-methyltransferase CheR [Phycisphaerales bacterium]|nr:protein-glutamate O-methyltransferase CheR [Phycisphaerales bacterium]